MLFLNRLYIQKVTRAIEPLFIEPHILWLMGQFYAILSQNHVLT